MNALPETLNELSRRIDQLEDRVARLEHPSAIAAIAASETTPAAETQATEAGSSVQRPPTSFAETASTFGLLGKAMLGIAGAYVLRAVAESSSLPRPATAALAILYASFWLIGAARTRTSSLAQSIYAGTAALILAPMLWELTLRFDVLTPAATAAVLAAFAAAAFGLAWKRQLTPVMAIVDVTVGLTAIALLVGTHRPLPFSCMLLSAVAIQEAAAIYNRWLNLRWILALAVDTALCLLLFVYLRPESSRSQYPPLLAIAILAACCTLLLIYAAGVLIRTLCLGHRITIFEILQSIAAFLLAATAVPHFAARAGIAAFAVACIVLALAGYAGTLLGRRTSADSRNGFVFSTWSLALLLFGLCLVPEAAWLPALLATTAIAATTLAARTSRITFAFHGLAYLLAATVVSGLATFAAHVFAGSMPEPPAIIAWLILAAAVLCYALGSSAEKSSRVFSFCSASLAVAALAVVLISALVRVASAFTHSTAWLVAVLRTLTGCLIALAAASLGPRLRRQELIRLAYAVLALLAVKLLLEDLPHGHAEFIAASIFLYAATLMLVPRIVRRATQHSAAAPPKASATPASATSSPQALRR